MSLVREALEKAEREAAARAAREKGLGPQLSATAQPYRAPRRRRWGLVAGTLAAVAIAALAALLLLRRPPTPAAPPVVVEAPVPAAVASAPAAPERTPPESGPAAPAEPVPAVVEPAPRTATERAQPAAPAPAAAEPAEHVREAVLDGGAVRLELGGIAWSEAAPLAYLNGRLRGVGEVVAGLRIERIDRDRVTLARADRRIVLLLR